MGNQFEAALYFPENQNRDDILDCFLLNADELPPLWRSSQAHLNSNFLRSIFHIINSVESQSFQGEHKIFVNIPECDPTVGNCACLIEYKLAEANEPTFYHEYHHAHFGDARLRCYKLRKCKEFLALVFNVETKPHVFTNTCALLLLPSWWSPLPPTLETPIPELEPSFSFQRKRKYSIREDYFNGTDENAQIVNTTHTNTTNTTNTNTTTTNIATTNTTTDIGTESKLLNVELSNEKYRVYQSSYEEHICGSAHWIDTCEAIAMEKAALKAQYKLDDMKPDNLVSGIVKWNMYINYQKLGFFGEIRTSHKEKEWDPCFYLGVEAFRCYKDKLVSRNITMPKTMSQNIGLTLSVEHAIFSNKEYYVIRDRNELFSVPPTDSQLQTVFARWIPNVQNFCKGLVTGNTIFENKLITSGLGQRVTEETLKVIKEKATPSAVVRTEQMSTYQSHKSNQGMKSKARRGHYKKTAPVPLPQPSLQQSPLVPQPPSPQLQQSALVPQLPSPQIPQLPQSPQKSPPFPPFKPQQPSPQPYQLQPQQSPQFPQPKPPQQPTQPTLIVQPQTAFQPPEPCTYESLVPFDFHTDIFSAEPQSALYLESSSVLGGAFSQQNPMDLASQPALGDSTVPQQFLFF